MPRNEALVPKVQQYSTNAKRLWVLYCWTEGTDLYRGTRLLLPNDRENTRNAKRLWRLFSLSWGRSLYRRMRLLLPIKVRYNSMNAKRLWIELYLTLKEVAFVPRRPAEAKLIAQAPEGEELVISEGKRKIWMKRKSWI